MGYLARKKYQPRITGIRQIRGLQDSVFQAEKIVNQLKKDRDSSIKQLQQLQSALNGSIHVIKHNERITDKDIKKSFFQLEQQAEDLMKALKSKVEEQERLRKIQEEMSRERKKKEEEERKRLEEEDNRRKRSEMGSKRKAEEEARKRQEEEDRRTAEQLQAELERNSGEQARFLEQLEQERRDHELALRLAQETNGQVDDDADISSQLRRSEGVMSQRAAYAGKKYDLSKWKYSELRDTINTSCDIELLEACREEFHRRLKVYHAWKARNKKRTVVMEENQRVPQAVLDAASKPMLRPRASLVPSDTQRFFRIPFVKPGENNGPSDKKGQWYAHFDGQWIARQMELHPDKAPVLLVAGKDDMQMCELSLDETGLTRKRGAEILEHEFVREWDKSGGSTYVRPGDLNLQGNRKSLISPTK